MVKKYTLVLFLLSLVFSLENRSLISSESYVTGSDGIIRMNVNVIGHVKHPGTHLVYDGIDLLSLLSSAGGYLEGANLKKIMIYHKDGTGKVVDLNDFFNLDTSSSNLIVLKPNDTVYVKQKSLSKIMRSSNLPSILLSILNIILTIERTE